MPKPHNVAFFIRRVSEQERLSRHDTQAIRERLDADVQAYLDNGGTVQQVPGFETTQDKRW